MAEKKAAKKAPAKKASKGKVSVVTQNFIVSVVVALLIGWGVGYVFGAMLNDDDAASSEADVSASESLDSHKHGLYEVSEEEAPTVQVLAEPDALGGWNVTLVTTNFEFTPEDVNEMDELGTGHAHIWVDGEKVGRVYSNNYHLSSLGEGDHEITVTLNTNKHKDYAVNGEVVSGTIEVTEVASDGSAHSHSDDDDHSHSDEMKDDDHMSDDGHSHGDDEDHSHSN